MPSAVRDPWEEVCAARIPVSALGSLAGVRGYPGVQVLSLGEWAWVRWPAGAKAVCESLRPVRGGEFFSRRGLAWFRLGAAVPTSDGPPEDAGKPLDSVIFPAKFAVEPAPISSGGTLPVRLVRGGKVHATTALSCSLRDLEAWADSGTTREIAAVSAARSGDRAILRGKALPAIPQAVRFWGEAVLVPVGFHIEPAVSPPTLRAAAGAGDGEVLVVEETGVEIVPLAAFSPLTRAGLRLAIRNAPAGEHA